MQTTITSPKPASVEVAQPASPAILIVDDEPSIIAAIKRILHGFTVYTAQSVQEALVVLECVPVDVVVTDCHMPRGNGLGLLDTIRRRYPRVHRVLMSGDGRIPGSELVNSQTVQRFVSKSDQLRSLPEVVADAAG